MDKNSTVLLLFTFILGVRHGFDLDHLATIDAITRNVSNNRHFAKYVGTLFSLGHGLVIICISYIVSTGLFHGQIPHWLEKLGNGISIFFLIFFSVFTYYSVIKNISPKTLSSTGIKSFLYNRLLDKVNHPLTIIIIGALFAVSFDTFSQITVFSLAAVNIVGGLFPSLLGITFMLGMMTADSLNSLLLSQIISYFNNRSLMINRLLGFAIATFSLSIGAMSLLQTLNP